MKISTQEKRDMLLGCIPFVSTVTGFLKAKSTNKNYSTCLKATDKSELEMLSDITARRLIDQNLDFKEEKKTLLKGYKRELTCNILETIPIIGNIVSFARSLYCCYSKQKPAEPQTGVSFYKEESPPSVTVTKDVVKEEQVSSIPVTQEVTKEKLASSAIVTKDVVKEEQAPSVAVTQEVPKEKPALSIAVAKEAVEDALTYSTPLANVTTTRVNIPGKDVHQVKVLNQYKLQGGFEQCGFHAFKNALVGISVANESSGIDPNGFTDVDQYNALKRFVDTFGPKKPKDASIAQLMDALECLSDPNEPLHESLQPFRTAVQAHFESISMFNANGGLSGSSGGAASLHTLANLSQFHKQDPPKTHAFLLGMEGHWISLLLQVDDQGKKVWYGMDSCPDSVTTRRFQKAIDLLEPVVDDPSAFIRKNYPDAMGEEIKRKANWFTAEGKIKDKTDLGTLFKSAPEFLKMLVRTYDFMKRSDWLNSQDPEIQGYVEDLRTYVSFYAQALRIPLESNPAVLEMCEGLQLVLERKREEVAFGQPVSLTEEAIQAFKNFGEEGPTAVVSRATVHYYLSQDALTPSENFKDYGWGCAWRCIKTVLSALPLPDVSIKEMFKKYKKGWSLVQAYKNISPDLDRAKRYQILSAAPEKWGNWAEPFIGQVYLADQGIKSTLELYVGPTETMHTPEFLFPHPPIGQFSQLTDKLFTHFSTNQSPVMIDNGRWAYTILGIKKSQDKIHLLIADPHTSQPNEALYTVTLDQTGKQIACSIPKKEEFPESTRLVRFDKTCWMMLFPYLTPSQ